MIMEVPRFENAAVHNKRKRKITASEENQEFETERPSKRQCSPPTSSSCSDHVSSTASTISSSSVPSPSLSLNSDDTQYTGSQGGGGSGGSVGLSSSQSSSYCNPVVVTLHHASSECYSTHGDFDFATLGSPPSSVNTCDDENYESLISVKQTTPHGLKKIPTWRQKSCVVTSSTDLRLCPLPPMSWADSEDVWKEMCRKDARGLLDRNPNMLQQHSGLQPRMRAILLDWLIEVCEVYKLHRETYYLAVDYLDRFLTTATMKINKTHLQLIGITCLFIAAKVEEIYPPKINEFAYVTDSACTEDDLIQQELILLKELKWYISPVTIMGWLSLYMQVNTTSNQKPVNKSNINNSNSNQNSACNSKNNNNSNHSNSNSGKGKSDNNNPVKFGTRNDDAFIYPQFSGMEYAHTAQLLDLCTLDVGIANFQYSVLAAAAMSHTLDRKRALLASGLEWEDIEECVKWMEPFYQVICEDNTPIFLAESNEQVKSSYGLHHICPRLITDESYLFQTHTISLTMFEKVSSRKIEILEMEHTVIYPEISPAIIDQKCPDGLLTPPASSRKPLDNNLINDVETDLPPQCV